MTSGALGRGPAGRGRRGNGLQAPGWVPVLDLDPRLAETVLDLLQTAGIAGYVEPSPGSTGGYREVRLPPTPTDRLFVDPQRRDEAAELLAAVLEQHARDLAATDEPGDRPDREPVPAGDGDDEDGDGDDRAVLLPDGQQPLPGLASAASAATPDDQAAWDDLVRRLTATDDAPVPPWPVDEDLDPPPTAPGRVLRRRSSPDPVDAATWLEPATADQPDEADDDEHFVPPPPPPVGRVTRATAMALTGFAVGLLLILRPGWIGLTSSDGTFAAGLLIILGAFAWLVYRLQDGPPLDSGPDDGAVV